MNYRGGEQKFVKMEREGIASILAILPEFCEALALAVAQFFVLLYLMSNTLMTD